MALIEWQPEFEIGIPAIDHEHRALIKLINDLHDRLASDPPAEEIAGFLGEVHAGISAHFALEERTMRELAYDELDAHKADHERLLDEIRDIMDAFDADARFVYGESLSERLRIWFGEHFRTMDPRLHHFIERQS